MIELASAKKRNESEPVKEIEFMGKPFVKWAGGKTQVLAEIRKRYPSGLGNSITKYAEPFVGGGAVLFDILNNYQIKEAYISDVNRELIETYKQIKNNHENLIFNLSELQSEYIVLDSGERKNKFYEKRKRFNELKSNNILGEEIAALFIFLNKTCFNGLYRVNSKGEFNVPTGVYKNPKICDKANIESIAQMLRNVEIVNAPYTDSYNFIDNNTFVYFDPPYRPLTATASFTSYTEGGFDDEEQIKLAHYIHKLHEKGALIVASNSDPKNSDPSDDFFDSLYQFMNVERIYANRAINSVGSKRGTITELLISNTGAVKLWETLKSG